VRLDPNNTGLACFILGALDRPDARIEERLFLREKELRIALVCFGGVSLAVYMHGICKEILKLVRASSALHRITDRSRRAEAAFFDQADPSDPEYDTESDYFELLQNALQGFSQNRAKPIKITSATLEVRDKNKIATFSGDVHLVQGDTTMRSKTLVVFYDDDAPAKSTPGQVGPQQNQQIKRVEAKRDVIVVQKGQTATGESGIFDMKSNTATLVGNVVISQGANVVRGNALTVDMTTGVSRMACGTAQERCRVHSSFQQDSMKPERRGQQAVPTRPRSSQPQVPSSQPKGLY
jgi:lipopolysaccharide export system protein LptA